MQTVIERSSDPVELRIRALVQDQPALLGAATVYEALVPVLRDAVFDVIPLEFAAPKVRVILGTGRPVLSELQFEIDVDARRDLLISLAKAVEKAVAHGSRMWWPLWKNGAGLRNSAAGRIRTAFEQDRLNVRTLMGHVVSGSRELVTEAALELDLDTDLTWLILQNSLRPSLRVWNEQLAPLIAQVPWQKNFCPVCGSAATLGELRGNYQEKHLRCSTCGADWTGRRLVCACCGNEDHRTQQCLYTEGRRERMHVEACDVCNGYLKIIFAFSPTPVELMPLEDLATSSLDNLAQARGYRRFIEA